MSKGNKICIPSNPRGMFLEGTITDTSAPGTIMGIVAATAPIGGEFSWAAAAPGTDGYSVLPAVLLEDSLQGFGNTTAYVSGTRCRMYVPIAGEQMNVLVGEVAGTGNTYAIGDKLYIDAESGILVPAVSAGGQWIMLETLTQVAGSTLAWVMRI